MIQWIKPYLDLNLSEYFPDFSFRINLFFLVMTIGLCLGCAIADIYNGVLARFLKKLLRANAIGPENAKTLAQLNEGGWLLRRFLTSESGRLAHYIDHTNASDAAMTPTPKRDEGGDEEENVSRRTTEKKRPEEQRFYIPAERRDEVLRFYERDASSPIKAIFLCVFLLAVWLVLALLMPYILALLASLVGG